jgi:hypothetical protein
MNFSIILNTRGRVEQLKRFIQALDFSTSNIFDVEVVIRCDIDDLPTTTYLNNINQQSPLGYNVIAGVRPFSLNASINELAAAAKGKYIFVLNDDAEVHTPDWDQVALNYFDEYKSKHNIKDDILYGLTSDTSADKPVGKTYASFPIISRQAVQALGYFMDPRFVGLGGDSGIYRVYQAIDRVVEMPNLIVDHVFHDTIFKVMAPDRTAAEMRANTYANPIDPFTIDITDSVQRLKNYIDFKNE